MSKKVDTKTESLDVYAYAAKTIGDTPWLHYGLWEPGDRVSVPNVRPAQERYVDLLLSFLPEAPKSVLDVGGGTGEMAALLKSKSYDVDMVTPSAVQADEARTKLSSDRVHQVMFEDFDQTGPFDVVLFSESFQYISLEDSLPKAKQLLSEGGRIVIADCFRRKDYDDRLAPGSGHRIDAFERAVDEFGLKQTRVEDVTEKVAPMMLIDQQFYREFVTPLVGQIDAMLSRSRPILRWFIANGYKLLVPKAERERITLRLAADYRSPEHYIAANTYRFISLEAKD